MQLSWENSKLVSCSNLKAQVGSNKNQPVPFFIGQNFLNDKVGDIP